jgi:hypothetical protein
MNDQHLSADTAARLKNRTLPPAEIEAAVTHAAQCATCRPALGSDAAAIRAAFAEDAPRHLTFDELSAIVDGRANRPEHLDECDLCRAELDDLRPLAQHPPGRRTWWLAAAAALVLALLIAMIALRREPSPDVPEVVDTSMTGEPQTTTADPPPSKWQPLVDQALASGRLPLPAFLATLGGPAQTLRGDGPNASQRLEPSGSAIESAQPELRWPRVANATHVASVFDGETMIIQSPPLKTGRWPLPRPLPRGTTYTWQVEAMRGGETTVLPAPPDPPARFHVISADVQRELEEARREHPDDHLLLAVVHAKAGLEREAREHLDRVESNDPRVEKLRR